MPTKAITNIANALSYINQNISKSLSLDNVSKAIYISPAYLSRLFKDILNINFIDYVNISKMNVAQEKLIMTKIPIIELSNNLGFSQASYFTKTFKKWTDLTPSEYRNRNKNVKQVYTISRTAEWLDDTSVFEISKRFFIKNNFSIKTKESDSNEYIYSINGLKEDQNQKNGWVYTVDCSHPSIPSNKFRIKNKSVIQWLYINND